MQTETWGGGDTEHTGTTTAETHRYTTNTFNNFCNDTQQANRKLVYSLYQGSHCRSEVKLHDVFMTFLEFSHEKKSFVHP